MMKKLKNIKDREHIKPLGDRVLIDPVSKEDSNIKSNSGIIIPETIDQKQTNKGKVIAIGDGKYDNNGNFIPMNLKKGDKVMFQWGDKIEVDEKEYFIVSEENILAIIK
jgi:chaperonin GroES